MQASFAESIPETELPPIRIILVDDHAIVREGVRAILDGRDDMQVIGEFANGTEALAVAAKLAPDLALCSRTCPGFTP
jgi:DNA-binding NarL/FixJ family response regulator